LVASHRTRGVGGTAVQTNTECDAWWNVARATVGTVAATSFRIRIAGSEHIPRRGGALIAYNHVSVLDAIFIGLAVTRRARIVRCFALSEDFERAPSRVVREAGQAKTELGERVPGGI